ncbi:AlkA N-terminal domain-containing protein [Nocardioides zeae]|uniref:DNA-3-methyladenine glycosylase II n=1 Tax=Nocardioides imazamoxiresistens TaxID=3231893 RepID=A0ABU3PYP0_9ACTN|nr:AlkA N-terminal domain-containing protein [Nocardioides zeae]MDT9593922.1 AlkA N-terminal domain-containing protein [Nocardioides zeae]
MTTSDDAAEGAGAEPGATTRRLDPEACYRAVSSRDRRFDGMFWTAVRTTGIYCRPSCPARTPALANVAFHPSAASAQRAGFRACKRCLPDAAPGSPEWDVAADVAGRAMRLIGDGLVDRAGVEGLADALGYTPRHVHRLLLAELGAGPLALARARRAQTARTLLESTDLPVTDVAFAAGFASVRQFNATVQEVYATSPRELRSARTVATTPPGDGSGALHLRLAVRTPYAGDDVLTFLAFHVVPGMEVVRGRAYARTLALPHGPAVLEVELVDVPAEVPGVAQLPVRLWLSDLRDTAAALERARRLLDADADTAAASRHLGADPLLAPLVAARPGLRVPGAVDGAELAIRAVIGQQVSVAGARTVTGRLVARHGEPLPEPLRGCVPGLTHVFPEPAALAEADPERLSMPHARGRAVLALAAALESGRVRLDRGSERDEVRARMVELPGIGPWTADYVALRALGHPDVFLPTDVGVRRAVAGLGHPPLTPERVEAWRPWRSYALLHLWSTVMPSAAPSAENEEES